MEKDVNARFFSRKDQRRKKNRDLYASTLANAIFVGYSIDILH